MPSMPGNPSPAKEGSISLNPDQVRLLQEVVTRLEVNFKPNQWDDIAKSIGAASGKAAKERYRYLLRAINGVPQKHQKDLGGLASTAVPRPAPITPGTFLKKRKAEISEEEEEVQEDKGATTPIPKPKRKSETATVKTKQPKSNATARANNKAKVAKDAEPEDEQQEAGLEVEDTDRVGAKDYNPHLTPRDPSKAFLCNGLADNLLTPEEHADLNSDIDAGDLNRLFPDLGGWVR